MGELAVHANAVLGDSLKGLRQGRAEPAAQSAAGSSYSFPPVQCCSDTHFRAFIVEFTLRHHPGRSCSSCTDITPCEQLKLSPQGVAWPFTNTNVGLGMHATTEVEPGERVVIESGQRRQLSNEAPCASGLYVPVGHGKHATLPAAAVYVPGGHALQDVCFCKSL